MSQKSIKIGVPATISNVGCGYDILGFETGLISDEIEVSFNDSGELRITAIEPETLNITREPKKNTCTKAILSLAEEKGIETGFDIKIKKKIGIGTGLGSSAASAVGGVFGVNKLLGEPFTADELFIHALEGEKLASGSAHADNVAPALFGGFILVTDPKKFTYVKVPVNADLHCMIIFPDIVINTLEARRLVPQELPLYKALNQAARMGSLVNALITGNTGALREAIVDEIAEPVRAGLIPRYYDIKEMLLSEGALGVNISGSGPAIFAFTAGSAETEELKIKAAAFLKEAGIKSEIMTTIVENNGPKVL